MLIRRHVWHLPASKKSFAMSLETLSCLLTYGAEHVDVGDPVCCQCVFFLIFPLKL